jgi:hypothetical protein
MFFSGQEVSLTMSMSGLHTPFGPFASPSAPHIPPRPVRLGRSARRPGKARALLDIVREASVTGIATLAFCWGLAELAFVLTSR